MAGVHVHSWRRYVGLALVTASILALQITFTRMFSIMIWHHLTYLIIGVALLGGGTSGTFLAVRGWSAATLERRLGRLVIGYSLIVLLNLAIIGGIAIDPLRCGAVKLFKPSSGWQSTLSGCSQPFFSAA